MPSIIIIKQVMTYSYLPPGSMDRDLGMQHLADEFVLLWECEGIALIYFHCESKDYLSNGVHSTGNAPKNVHCLNFHSPCRNVLWHRPVGNSTVLISDSVMILLTIPLQQNVVQIDILTNHFIMVGQVTHPWKDTHPSCWPAISICNEFIFIRRHVLSLHN